MTAKELWEKALLELQEKLSKPNYQTWFKNKTSVTSFDEKTVEIGCLNTYAKDFLDKRYSTLLKEVLDRLTNKDVKVRFVVDKTLEKAKTTPVPLFDLEDTEDKTKESTIDHKVMLANLNLKYTFDSFVVGNNNRLAHAVAISVSKLPAKSYNPFFLYGGVGVGKTHLMHAIGHEILRTLPNLKVLYCTGESFTNEMIEAIQNRRTGGFRSKYRGIDVLLIDDIQFIAGRDTTQEEFFHTFNDLHSSGKQVVMTSDRPPKDIAKLEARVKSRFEWGMIADIQIPDTDMREAILLSKCKEKNISVPQEVLHYLAENVTSSIRDLEGSLTRLVTTSTLLNKPLNLELAAQVAAPEVRPVKTSRVLNAKDIIDKVCEYYNVKLSDIKSPKRHAEIALPRQVIMYILRIDLGLQLMGIAKLLGGRDHTTIMYGVDKISKTVEKDTNLSGQIGEIRTSLHN